MESAVEDDQDHEMPRAELEKQFQHYKERVEDLEDYVRGLELQQERSDEVVRGLEETVKRQSELISEQSSDRDQTRVCSDQEVTQLHEIIDAQQGALDEQRRIIETQAALIEDLQQHFRDCDRPQSEGGMPSYIGNPADGLGDLRNLPALHAPQLPPGAAPGGGGAPGVPLAGSESRRPRNDQNSRSLSGRPSPRNYRDMLMGTPHVKAGSAPSGVGGPPRPRPNSAFGKQAPRSRSCHGDSRSSVAADPYAGAGNPHGMIKGVPTTCLAQGPPGRKNRLPPALPLLKQEA